MRQLVTKALLLLFALSLIGADPIEVRTTRHGSFVIRDFSAFRRAEILGRLVCHIGGEIENRTDGSWEDAEFTFVVLGQSESGQAQRLETKLSIGLPFGTTTSFSQRCVGDFNPFDVVAFDVKRVTATFEGGYRTPSPAQANEKRQPGRQHFRNIPS